MGVEIQTVVTFQSTAFNVTETKPYFINPSCYGDDVAKWMIAELRKNGVKTDDAPDQEDFGWYFGFQVAGGEHTFVIGFRPDDKTWIGWLERNRGFARSILGLRKRGIDPSAQQVLHSALLGSPEIRNVRWHFHGDFDKGREERGTLNPLSSSQTTQR